MDGNIFLYTFLFILLVALQSTLEQILTYHLFSAMQLAHIPLHSSFNQVFFFAYYFKCVLPSLLFCLICNISFI